MRFRLRYLQHDLELTEGEFAVGRNASCQLSLDDPLVSRRHALLIVTPDGVDVEDLQSRNGVLVNGQRIHGRVRLAAGDTILIGAQEMTILPGHETQASAHHRANMTLPKMAAATPAPSSGPPGAVRSSVPAPAAVPYVPSAPPPRIPTPPPGGTVPLRIGSSTLQSRSPAGGIPAVNAGRGSRVPAAPGGGGVPSSAPGVGSLSTGSDEFELSMVRRADAFALLGGVAEKALAMGRAVEAERILASPLGDVIEASRAGKRVTPSLVDQAARFSAKLATATGKGAWADYVIELYAAQRRPCPAPVIDELYNALRRVTAIDLQRLREYIEDLRTRLHTFGPAERFLFQRLEGLERLAALR